MRNRIVAGLFVVGAVVCGAWFALVFVSKILAGDPVAYLNMAISAVACFLLLREARRLTRQDS